MDTDALLDAYRRVDTEELYKIVNVVGDAINRWEMKVQDEPYLRIRIRQGYDCIKLVQLAIAERFEPVDEYDA